MLSVWRSKQESETQMFQLDVGGEEVTAAALRSISDTGTLFFICWLQKLQEQRDETHKEVLTVLNVPVKNAESVKD